MDYSNYLYFELYHLLYGGVTPHMCVVYSKMMPHSSVFDGCKNN